MPLADTVLSKLKAIPGWTATAEHVAFLRDILVERDKELADLQSKCDRLRDENSELQKRIAEISSTEDYVEYRGVLWRRIDSDTVEPAPYCKKCKHIMVHFAPAKVWCCDTCQADAPYVQHPQAAKE